MGDERERGAEKPCRNITSFYLGSSASLKLKRPEAERRGTSNRDKKIVKGREKERSEREGEQAKTLI